MTRVEQERLVGNYLRGEMSAAEEQEFFIQVALDTELRQTLKAFRVVDTAIQKHREAISPNHAESYQRLIAMLGSSAMEPAALVTATATSALRQGIGALSARFFTWTSALVATGALSVGALVLGPALNNDSAPEKAQVESVSPQTMTSEPAIVPLNSTAATPRVTQQEAEEITTGTPVHIPPGASTTQKSATQVDPTAIIGDARKKTRSDEKPSVFSAAQKSSTTDASPTSAAPQKPGVKFTIITPANAPDKDTIKLPVDLKMDGIDQ